MASASRVSLLASLACFAAKFQGCRALMQAGSAFQVDARGVARKIHNEETGVSYGDDVANMADVYWPADPSLRPDGGWSAVIMLPAFGDNRTVWRHLCVDHVVPSGRLCVAGDFRQVGPGGVQDVYNLAVWLGANAANYSVNASNIIVGGTGVAGLRVNDVIWDPRMGHDLLGGGTPKVKAAMLLSGASDDDADRASKAEFFPSSTYICHSDNDPLIPYEYSVALYDTLVLMGEHAKLVNISNSSHFIWHSENRGAWYDELMTFVEETVP